ncbi:MAG: hypothetical protein A1D16_05905 [Flavihumibacter sp. CACIAM 22H1]|nr:MAG: hypothetical protein A1D16_05905 [Flavihumibacter sp. CACIAM 22H1]
MAINNQAGSFGRRFNGLFVLFFAYYGKYVKVSITKNKNPQALTNLRVFLLIPVNLPTFSCT